MAATAVSKRYSIATTHLRGHDSVYILKQIYRSVRIAHIEQKSRKIAAYYFLEQFFLAFALLLPPQSFFSCLLVSSRCSYCHRCIINQTFTPSSSSPYLVTRINRFAYTNHVRVCSYETPCTYLLPYFAVCVCN